MDSSPAIGRGAQICFGSDDEDTPVVVKSKSRYSDNDPPSSLSPASKAFADLSSRRPPAGQSTPTQHFTAQFHKELLNQHGNVSSSEDENVGMSGPSSADKGAKEAAQKPAAAGSRPYESLDDDTTCITIHMKARPSRPSARNGTREQKGAADRQTPVSGPGSPSPGDLNASALATAQVASNAKAAPSPFQLESLMSNYAQEMQDLISSPFRSSQEVAQGDVVDQQQQQLQPSPPTRQNLNGNSDRQQSSSRSSASGTGVPVTSDDDSGGAADHDTTADIIREARRVVKKRQSLVPAGGMMSPLSSPESNNNHERSSASPSDNSSSKPVGEDQQRSDSASSEFGALQELELVRAQLAEAQDRIDKVDGERSALQLAVSERDEQLAEHKQQVTSLQATLHEVQEKEQSQRRKLDDIQKESKTLEHAFSTMHRRYEQLKQEKKGSNDNVDRLQTDLVNARKQLNVAKGQQEKQEAEFQMRLAREVASLEERAKTAAADAVADVEQRLAKAHSEMRQRWADEMVALGKKWQSAESQLKLARNELASQKEANKELVQITEELIGQLSARAEFPLED